VYTIQIKEKESELRALQAHINPHFLYNTLASISWLSMRIGSDDITRISNALARFYKLSLSKGSSIVNLQEEIDHVKAYMSIQEIRFKSRIRMLYEIAPETLEIPTLKLILQPFVENALVHGMWREKKTITIKLQIEVEDHVVTAKIIDDGVGIGSETLKRLQRLEDKDAIGYGIVNVDQRLKLYYGDRYGVDIFSRRGIGTVISVIMPIR
jgi:two-component system sensor histidine kinase YesM